MEGSWQWLLTFVPAEVPPGAPFRPNVDPNLFMPRPFAMFGHTPFVQSHFDQWLAAGKGAAFCDKGFGKGGFNVENQNMSPVSEVGAGNPIHGSGIAEMFGKGCGCGSEKTGKGFSGNDFNAEDALKGSGKGFGKDYHFDPGLAKGKMDAETIGKGHAKDSDAEVVFAEDVDVAKNSKKRQIGQVVPPPPPMQPTVKSKARPLTPTPPQTNPPPRLVKTPDLETEEVVIDEPESEAVPSSSESLQDGGYYQESKHESYQKRAWNWYGRTHPWNSQRW